MAKKAAKKKAGKSTPAARRKAKGAAAGRGSDAAGRGSAPSGRGGRSKRSAPAARGGGRASGSQRTAAGRAGGGAGPRSTARKPAGAAKATLSHENKRVLPAPAAASGGRKSSGSGLSAKDIQYFRGLLLDKRRELARDVGGMQEEALRQNRQDATGNLSSMPIHMADLGTDNYEQELTLGLIAGERALLAEIDEALARIEAGTYGICAATGKPIGKARLKATPWTKYCYDYMLSQEKRFAR